MPRIAIVFFLNFMKTKDKSGTAVINGTMEGELKIKGTGIRYSIQKAYVLYT